MTHRNAASFSEPATGPIEGLVRVDARVVDLDLGRPAGELSQLAADGTWAERAWVLVRLHGEPLGRMDVVIPPEGLSAAEFERVVLGRFRDELAIRNVVLRPASVDGDTGGRPPEDAAGRAVAPVVHDTEFSRDHAAFLAVAPRCSVVVCTRERPIELMRCLDSLTRQDHGDFAVWVVDNAPATSATRNVVDSFKGRLDVHYLLEKRPGLSRARNAALRQHLDGDIVCWIDDDEVADTMWVSETLRAFTEVPAAAAASGVVVPAELRTRAQVWFEQYGGHSKGRGFTPDVFSPQSWRRQHPLYPLPPFGVGANMAFRTDVLRRLGGFDEALGAGTPSQGSEDTKIFSDVLRSGGTSVYWPTAVVRHFHRSDADGLRRQMRGYGSGLTAFYVASVCARPSTVIDLVRLAPRAVRDQISPSSLRVSTLGEDFPPELLVENRRGLLAGPWLYARGRLRNRRDDRRGLG